MGTEQTGMVDATVGGSALEVSRVADFDAALEAERGRRGAWGAPSTPSTSGHVVHDGMTRGSRDGAKSDKDRLVEQVLVGLVGKGADEHGSGVKDAAASSHPATDAARDKIYARNLARGFMRYGNDVILGRGRCAPSGDKEQTQQGQDAKGQEGGHSEDEERATLLARSTVPGYMVVGTSSGDICVVTLASGKVEALETGGQRSKRGGGSGGRGDLTLTALAIEKVRDVVVVGAGYASGMVKVWHASRTSSEGKGASRPSPFVSCAPIVDCHASGIVHLSFGNISDEKRDAVLLSVDGYGRIISHLVPRLLANATSVAAMMSSGAYSQSLASLSSNIYSSVSSVLRGTSLGLPLGGEGLSPGSASMVNGALMEEVGRVHGVIGVGCREGEDRIVLKTEKAGVVIVKIAEGSRLVVDTVLGSGWGQPDGRDGCEEGQDAQDARQRGMTSDKELQQNELRGNGVGEDTSRGEVVAACLRDGHTMLAVTGGDSERIVRLHNMEENTFISVECPGVVQDVLFLHHGMFMGVVHYDDASGKTLLTLVPVPGLTGEEKPPGISKVQIVSDEITSSFACNDLYDIYVKGSAVGGDGASDVVLLTSSGVRCVQLMSWKQKLSSMVASKKFEEALMHAVLLYADDGDVGRYGWPANEARDATAVSKQVMSLLILFVQNAVDDAQTMEQETHAERLARLALDVCSLVSEYSAFYRDLPPLFQRSKGAWAAYLDMVLECCRSPPYTVGAAAVPPQIIQSLVERVASLPDQAGKLRSLEDALLSFDVSSLDLNQVLPMCIKYGLYSVLIYVFTRGMKDFKSPASLLVAKAAAQPAGSEARRVLVTKLLVFIYACFEGISYPLGSESAQRGQSYDSKTTMRLEMMDFLLYGTVAEIRDTVSLWESLSGSAAEYGEILSHLESFDSPVLAFLCEVDARTTLRLLRNLLSGWDGLESDLEPAHNREGKRRTSETDGTLSQAVVNRVVSLLDDSDEDANRVKLDFIAELISSNRASLPPKATISVLAFLCRDAPGGDEDAGTDRVRAVRDKFLDIVKHAPAGELGDDVLELARQAGLAAAEAEILIKRGAYHEAIRSLIKSESDAMRVFSCYREVAGRRDDTATAFQKAVLPDFPLLVGVDARAAAEIAVDLAGHQHKEIIDSFEKGSNSQFRFLHAVVTVLRERDQGSEGAEQRYEGSPWIALLKSKAMSNTYIRLMCRFDPDSVLGYLQTADYDVDECLECCRANGLRSAQAFLLDRMGDLDAAFGIYLEDIEATNVELVSCVTPDEDADLVSRAGGACEAAISLCMRLQSPTRQSTRLEQVSQRDKPDQPDPKYKEMITSYVRSYALNRGTLMGWVKSVLTGLIKHVAEHAGHTEALIEHVIETFKDVPTGDMKDILEVLLTVCTFEEKKLELAVSIAQKDVSVALDVAYRKLLMGRPV